MPRWKLLANYQGLTLDNGHRRVVCNGYLPEREIQTGIGPVAIKVPKVCDRGEAKGGRKVQFSSKILPPYLRRTKSIEELIPWLYLKGISTGEFSEAWPPCWVLTLLDLAPAQ
jgi:putative transposase